VDISKEVSHLYEMASAYLNGQRSLEDFEDWFVPRIEVFLSLPNHSAYHLAVLASLGLAEMNIGHRSEDEYRSLLHELVYQPVLTIDDSPFSITVASSDESSGGPIELEELTPSSSGTLVEVAPS